MDGLTIIMRFIPKNLLSYFIGVIVRLRLPQPLSTWLIKGFVRLFHIDLSEADGDISSFSTIEDVFTRALKPGSRPIHSPICSPADGTLVISAPAEEGSAVQAKGLHYNLTELIFERDPVRPADFSPYWYQTIYLAPHNYHRVHAPFSGQIKKIRYIPGELWPVNQFFVQKVVQLFNRNERLVFDFELTSGGQAYVVMVGATNVGRMSTPFSPGLFTNSWSRQLTPLFSSKNLLPPPQVTIGEELGTFMLGSTVIVVYDKLAASGLTLMHLSEPRPILMGQALTGDIS